MSIEITTHRILLKIAQNHNIEKPHPQWSEVRFLSVFILPIVITNGNHFLYCLSKIAIDSSVGFSSSS